MKLFVSYLSLASIVSAQCSTGPAASVDLYVLFDVAGRSTSIAEYTTEWSEGLTKYGDWVNNGGKEFWGSYSRVSDFTQKQCWIEEVFRASSQLLAEVVKARPALPGVSQPEYLPLEMAGAWLYQKAWHEESSRRRILFMATGVALSNWEGVYIKFAPNVLINPTQMCPITKTVYREQHTFSIRRSRAGVLFASLPSDYDDSRLVGLLTKYLKGGDIMDFMVIDKKTLLPGLPHIVDEVRKALLQMTCASWLSSTTTLPPCWKEQQVTECIYTVDRDSSSWKRRMFSDCFLPSCYDWDTANSCVQQLNPKVACNWVDDLFECINA